MPSLREPPPARRPGATQPSRVGAMAYGHPQSDDQAKPDSPRKPEPAGRDPPCPRHLSTAHIGVHGRDSEAAMNPNRPCGLLEPDAATSGTSGSEGAAAQQCAAATRPNDAMDYLEKLYPGRIGEACFIDADGAENARVVRGERAAVDDLSPDESGNPFFRPTFALRQGQVYQARPYVSPDTDEWVLANSTVVPSRDGVNHAIVHVEVTVEGFREEAAAYGTGPMFVVDAQTGAVVIDTAQPQRIGAPLGAPTEHRFAGVVSGWKQSGQLTIGGRLAAYQRVDDTPGNANHWYAVALAPSPTNPLTGVGALAIVLVAVSLLLVAYVVAALWRGALGAGRAAHPHPPPRP